MPRRTRPACTCRGAPIGVYPGVPRMHTHACLCTHSWLPPKAAAGGCVPLRVRARVCVRADVPGCSCVCIEMHVVCMHDCSRKQPQKHGVSTPACPPRTCTRVHAGVRTRTGGRLPLSHGAGTHRSLCVDAHPGSASACVCPRVACKGPEPRLGHGPGSGLSSGAFHRWLS